ncbi:MAG: hypothetical protein K8I30_19020, partial [Anaerolineae bacterium]|nr:hypothetical protein [Anaerolineae bacterium]
MLASFSIDDAILSPTDDYVEVTLTFDDGSERWCFFITPDYIARSLGNGHADPKPLRGHEEFSNSIAFLGETLTTETGAQFGMVYAPHMLIVSELSESVIAETLRYLEMMGELED